MGNSLGRRRTAKVMKVDGETLKFKTPVRVSDILKDYPDHVLMDSEAVRHLGVRAKGLDVDHVLKPKRLYFLVQLPKICHERAPRKVRSGAIYMSARERLESLMLSRRSVSDLSHMKVVAPAPIANGSEEGAVGALRVKMRLPKAQVARLMEESKDPAEVAQKIMELCISDTGEAGAEAGAGAAAPKEDGNLPMEQKQWKHGLGSIQEIPKPTKKLGVRFQPIQSEELR